MECFYHPGIDAIGTCTSCGRAICQQDAVEVQGKLICRQDLAKGQTAAGGTNLVAYRGKNYDVNIAFILELLPGLIGFLGIGYIYVGETNDGVIRLIIWLIMIWGGWIVAGLLSLVFIGFCLMPLILVVQVGVPIWSAISLKNKLVASGLS